MDRGVEGQIHLADIYHSQEDTSLGCGDCVCRSCLHWASGRCPYGGCYDDLRAEEDPYPKAHPAEPPRKLWSDWKKPGELDHWCRGGLFYPSHWCWFYVRYTGQRIRMCLESNVSIFQDGYVKCSYTPGCEECYQMFKKRIQKEEEDAK